MPAHRPPPSHTVGRALPWRLRCLAWLLHAFYFGRFPIRGVAPPDNGVGPRLIVASHRNGAIDGYTVLRAFPQAQFLVAVQLLRSPWLRLLFGGIPVVRDKDRERYGLRRAAYGDPIEAACAHLRAGGDLVLFPEGTSEWGHRPQPYQRGAARIARVLLAEGVPLQIVPMGLHYAQPDRFRSRAEALIGAPPTLPPRDPAQPQRVWENQLHHTIGAALDAVSVNCPDAQTFTAIQAQARARMAQGASYAEALIDAQAQYLASGTPPSPSAAKTQPVRPWDAALMACFGVVCAPVLLAGWWVGRKADGRNTVTFFRMIGGLAAAVLWLPALLALSVAWPLPMLPALALAGLGWWRYPAVFRQEA